VVVVVVVVFLEDHQTPTPIAVVIMTAVVVPTAMYNPVFEAFLRRFLPAAPNPL
jgi:hypothetical protein